MAPYWIGVRRIILAACIGLGAGLASAFFLEALNATTRLWLAYPLLIWGLPVVGFVMAALYRVSGPAAAAGNNLIINAVHDPESQRVPLRLFPLVLGSTLLTHLCGGSAGREGTAVQMAGSIVGTVIKYLHIDRQESRLLLMAGISAGFASVFGTPLAGMVFGMEVLAIGSIRMKAAVPCLIAAMVGDATVRLLGVAHGQYLLHSLPVVSPGLIGWSVLAGVVFAGIAVLFVEGNRVVEGVGKQLIRDSRWRTAVGGVVVITFTYISGTREYNGLSLPLLSSAFSPAGVPMWAFALKLLFTVVTLGFGFKGGEVTPLFVIGATAGATIGRLCGLPMDVMAALGFVAVFGAAAQTPLACLILGVELFGAGLLVPMAIVVVVAVACVGQRGIYHAQRITSLHDEIDSAQRKPMLSDVQSKRSSWRWFTLD